MLVMIPMKRTTNTHSRSCLSDDPYSCTPRLGKVLNYLKILNSWSDFFNSADSHFTLYRLKVSIKVAR